MEFEYIKLTFHKSSFTDLIWAGIFFFSYAGNKQPKTHRNSKQPKTKQTVETEKTEHSSPTHTHTHIYIYIYFFFFWLLLLLRECSYFVNLLFFYKWGEHLIWSAIWLSGEISSTRSTSGSVALLALTTVFTVCMCLLSLQFWILKFWSQLH